MAKDPRTPTIIDDNFVRRDHVLSLKDAQRAIDGPLDEDGAPNGEPVLTWQTDATDGDMTFLPGKGWADLRALGLDFEEPA